MKIPMFGKYQNVSSPLNGGLNYKKLKEWIMQTTLNR